MRLFILILISLVAACSGDGAGEAEQQAPEQGGSAGQASGGSAAGGLAGNNPGMSGSSGQAGPAAGQGGQGGKAAAGQGGSAGQGSAAGQGGAGQGGSAAGQGGALAGKGGAAGQGGGVEGGGAGQGAGQAGAGGAGAGGAGAGGAQGGAGGSAGAGGAKPCGCFEGAGVYCAKAVQAQADESGCALPKAASEHPDDLLRCEGGDWFWDTTCKGGCNVKSKNDSCMEAVYQLPWGCGKEKTCTAVNAESDHHVAGSISEFAYDFSFKPDNKVFAARGGHVVVLDFGTKPGDPCYGGGGQSCASAANGVTLRHSDGTVAQYLHMNAKAEGLVEGDYVEQGRLVGYSGNTGWSTGPHLHFMVMQKGCTSLSCQSIPISFFKVGKPSKGKAYTSQNCP